MDAALTASSSGRPRRLVAVGVRLVILGMTFGMFLDWIHVVSGTTVYTHPTVGTLAWWAFPLFGVAYLAAGLVRPLAEHVLSRPTRKSSSALLGFLVVAFTATYFASAWAPSWLTCAIGLGAIGYALFALEAPWITLGVAVVAAVIGVGCELTIISLGGFRYVTPDLWTVRVWLPILYAMGGVTWGELGKRWLD